MLSHSIYTQLPNNETIITIGKNYYSLLILLLVIEMIYFIILFIDFLPNTNQCTLNYLPKSINFFVLKSFFDLTILMFCFVPLFQVRKMEFPNPNDSNHSLYIKFIKLYKKYIYLKNINLTIGIIIFCGNVLFGLLYFLSNIENCISYSDLIIAIFFIQFGLVQIIIYYLFI
jgi:hypothetical protein